MVLLARRIFKITSLFFNSIVPIPNSICHSCLKHLLVTIASYVPIRIDSRLVSAIFNRPFLNFFFVSLFKKKKKKNLRIPPRKLIVRVSFIDDRSGRRFSEHEPPDATLATKFRRFRELEAASMTVFGHFALGHAGDSVAHPTIAPRQILQVEATSRHVVGAASVVRIFAI